MPLNIPSRPDLISQVKASMQARLPNASVQLRRSVVGVLSFVWAASLWPLYRLCVWVAKQLFIDSAEAPYLDRRLAPYGVIRLGATPAAGNVIFTGTANAGIDIPAGTQVQNADGSVQYATQSDAPFGSSSTVTVAVVALVAGSAGNVAPGGAVSLVVGIAGVQPAATADSSGLTGGTDQESDQALRIRGQQRIQNPPQGGAGTDYVAWAKGVPGVTRAWVYPRNRGLGTVDVIFVMDGRANNIPLSGDVAAVQAAITASNVAPVTADVLVLAPTGDPLTVTVTNLVPNTLAIQAAVTAQLNALARRMPAGSATIGDGVTAASPGAALELEDFYDAISASGAIGFDLTAPTADVTFAQFHLPGTWTINLPALP